MLEPAQIGAGGVVKTDLGAVIGMRAPADVMQQAGGLDDPLFLPVGAGKQRAGRKS
jgi:hypothetical protein